MATLPIEALVSIKAELEEAQETLIRFMEDEANLEAIECAALLLANCLKNDGTILACGNGGSHCDAMHFTEELTGRYRENRPAMAAIAIAEPAYISCVGNDYGYDAVFSRYVEGVGKKGDVLVGISTSGNSENIIKAAKTAKEKGMKFLALTGKEGGKMAKEKGLCDVEIRVHHNGYADRVQEVHIKVIHILIKRIEELMGYAQ